jgi:polyphosphate kinase 2 (PPK2 family)
MRSSVLTTTVTSVTRSSYTSHSENGDNSAHSPIGTQARLPHITPGIFNRSHYEEVLAVRVHPALLEKQRLPSSLIGKRIWAERLEAIAAFEHHLARQGWAIQKFFLHISKEEQKRRFLSRLEEPEKNWKFSASDLAERGCWDDYMAAYEQAIAVTAAPHAPWFVVPADNKWFSRLVVVAAINEALDKLDLKFPTVDKEARAALDAARAQLESER